MAANNKKIASFKGFWQTLFKSLSFKGTVLYNTYDIVFRNPTPAALAQPGVKTFKEKPFWFYTTGSAEKDKNWKWWGDTDVSVYEIKGPKSLQEVNIPYEANFFLISIALSQACEAAIIGTTDSIDYDATKEEEVQFASWKQFWDTALRDLEHDLPNWPGAPLSAIWLRPFEGNALEIIAQKDESTFYYVSLATS